MTLPGISLPDSRRYSPLCIDGNACPGTGLRQDQHLADLDELDGCPERRDAATDNQETVLDVIHSSSTPAPKQSVFTLS